jgi:hypothetical protein
MGHEVVTRGDGDRPFSGPRGKKNDKRSSWKPCEMERSDGEVRFFTPDLLPTDCSI